MADTRSLFIERAIVKAIVCLNFNEPEKALELLFDALIESNATVNTMTVRSEGVGRA